MECWRPAGEVGLEACCWGSGVSHVCGGLVRCCVVRVSVWRGVRVVVENCIVDASIFIFCCVTCCLRNSTSFSTELPLRGLS